MEEHQYPVANNMLVFEALNKAGTYETSEEKLGINSKSETSELDSSHSGEDCSLSLICEDMKPEEGKAEHISSSPCNETPEKIEINVERDEDESILADDGSDKQTDSRNCLSDDVPRNKSESDQSVIFRSPTPMFHRMKRKRAGKQIGCNVKDTTHMVNGLNTDCLDFGNDDGMAEGHVKRIISDGQSTSTHSETQNPLQRDSLPSASDSKTKQILEDQQMDSEKELIYGSWQQNEALNNPGNFVSTSGEDKSHACSACDQVFAKASGLKKHKASCHRGEIIYPCAVCERVFTSAQYLKMHMKSHAGNKHMCSVCDKPFTASSDLTRHMRSHTGEKPYPCTFCQKPFRSASSLKVHMRIHTGERPHQCTVCEKSFTTASHLKRHMRGERLFLCSLCPAKFHVASNLRAHMSTHTGKKPYACCMCDKAYDDSFNLKIHERSHTGYKPHTCDICQKAFSTASDLRRHVRSHTGEKPFSCSVCEKKFTDASNLKKHMKVHMGEKWDDSSLSEVCV